MNTACYAVDQELCRAARQDAFYGFPGNSTKPRHETYRRFREIEGLGGTGVIGDISRDMR